MKSLVLVSVLALMGPALSQAAQSGGLEQRCLAAFEKAMQKPGEYNKFSDRNFKTRSFAYVPPVEGTYYFNGDGKITLAFAKPGHCAVAFDYHVEEGCYSYTGENIVSIDYVNEAVVRTDWKGGSGFICPEPPPVNNGGGDEGHCDQGNCGDT